MKYTTDNFIRKSKKVHGNRYDYAFTICNHWSDKVSITCKQHGVFVIRAQHHVNSKRGCKFCTGKFDNALSFLEKAAKNHGNKYDYSLVEYVNAHANIKIICPKHGVFQQTPMTHNHGGGCRKCADENLKGLYCDSFFKRNPKSKEYPAWLYLIDIWRGEERFLKLGITTTDVAKRWKLKNKEILMTKSMPLYRAYCTEQDLLSRLNNYKYVPKDKTMRFRGRNECFDIIDKDKIIKICTEETMMPMMAH